MHAANRPLLPKRGKPWIDLRFKTKHPGTQVQLVGQEQTPEFGTYLGSIVEVSNCVNMICSLFGKARRIREGPLLRPKATAKARSNHAGLHPF